MSIEECFYPEIRFLNSGVEIDVYVLVTSASDPIGIWRHRKFPASLGVHRLHLEMWSEDGPSAWSMNSPEPPMFVR